MNRWFCRIQLWSGVVLTTTLCLAVPAFAGPLGGDGSGANNPDLLRGGFQSTCVDSWLCDEKRVFQQPRNTSVVSKTPPQRKLPQKVDCRSIDPLFWVEMGCVPSKEAPIQRQVHNYDPLPPAPESNFGSKFEADWQLVLRGTYDKGSNGERFGVEFAPEVSISRGSATTEVNVGVNASVVKEGGDELRLSGSALEFDAAHLLNSDTGVGINLGVDVSQDSSYSPATVTGIAQQPIVVTGQGAVTLERRAGRFGFELGADAERQIYGSTQLTDGTFTDNSDRNRTGLGGRVRAQYEATDRVDVFVEGSAVRDIYDVVSPSLGAQLDSWTYSITAGVSGDWNEVITADISAGYGLRRFDSNLLADVPVALASAELTYRPDETLELSALFETNISAPSSTTASSAQIDYSASANASYRINDRITIRGNLGGTWTKYTSTGTTQSVYSAGVGADYNLNKQTVLNADYSYNLSEGSATARAENQRVSLGITYSR